VLRGAEIAAHTSSVRRQSSRSPEARDGRCGEEGTVELVRRTPKLMVLREEVELGRDRCKDDESGAWEPWERLPPQRGGAWRLGGAETKLYPLPLGYAAGEGGDFFMWVPTHAPCFALRRPVLLQIV
jgi:hypothetical protein